jgi:hypothetical protein
LLHYLYYYLTVEKRIYENRGLSNYIGHLPALYRYLTWNITKIIAELCIWRDVGAENNHWERQGRLCA